jgi:hypothetical protein
MARVKLPKGYEIRHRNAIREGDNSVPKWASDAYHVLDGRTDPVASGRTPGEAKRNAMRSGRTTEPFDTSTKVDTGNYYAKQYDDRGKPRKRGGRAK